MIIGGRMETFDTPADAVEAMDKIARAQAREVKATSSVPLGTKPAYDPIARQRGGHGKGRGARGRGMAHARSNRGAR